MINYENVNNAHDLIQQICNGKGEFLEIHNLRFYSPCLINRDENGDAKTVYINGVRSLYSSQSRKAAIRHDAVNSRSERTRRAPERIAQYMKEQHPELTEEYLYGVMDVVSELFKKNTDKDKTKYFLTSAVVNIGKEDIKRISKGIEEHFGLETVPNLKEANALATELESLLNASKVDYDICLFGRMSTSRITDTIHSASFFSFNYAINENAGDSDDFIAQEAFDNQCSIFGKELDSKLGKGAAHMDNRNICADTFYEYCGFSIPAYLENVMKGVDFSDKKLVQERLREAFDYLIEVLKYCILTTPSSMQHQMCSANTPVSFICLTQDAQNTTYGSRFEHQVVPTKDLSVMDIGVKRFVDAINDETFFTGSYLKKYWLSKQYSHEAKIEDVNNCTLKQMLTDLQEYFYEKIGI